MFCFATCLYLWGAGFAVADIETAELVVNKNVTLTITLLSYRPKPKGGTSSPSADFDKDCSYVCTKREVIRKEKFGGDLLDFSDIVKSAEAGKVKGAIQTSRGLPDIKNQLPSGSLCIFPLGYLLDLFPSTMCDRLNPWIIDSS